MVTETPLDIARDYLNRGWAVVPLPPTSKAPKLKSWTQLRITPETVGQYFNGAEQNVGVILGEASGGLVDVDLDCTEAVEAAAEILPRDTAIFGRPASPASHYLYQCPGVATVKYQYGGRVLAELRSTGAQTMFPGSVHPDGEWVEFENALHPQVIEASMLQQKIAQVAAAAMLAQVLDSWDTGRHDAYLNLTGALLHGGVSPGEVQLLLRATLAATRDSEQADRLRAINDTIEKFESGEPVSGWPQLQEKLPGEVIDNLRRWLNIQNLHGLSLGGRPLNLTAGTSSRNSGVAEHASILPDSAPLEPQPLLREIEPGEPYPLDALGPVLQPMAELLSRVVGAPGGLCAQSVLAAAALAAQAHADVQLGNIRQPLSVALLTIAKTGERKTTIDEMALAPVRAYERQLQEQYPQRLREHQLEAELWKQRRDEAVKSGKETDTQNALELLGLVGCPPVPPPAPNLIVDDPTVQGLVKHLERNWPSVGLFTDEGAMFLGGWSMKDTNKAASAGTLSKLWDGSPITRMRAGEDNSKLFGRRVSLHLMVQPNIAPLLLGDDVFYGQGLLSRFLISYPASTMGTRSFFDDDVYTHAAALKYRDAIAGLLSQEPQWSSTLPNTLQPRTVQAQGQAKDTLIAFYNHVEKQLGTGGGLEPIAGLASKALAHAMRLAAILTLLEQPGALYLLPTAVDNAVRLVQYYFDEALRLIELSRENPELVQAEKLLIWAQNRGELIHAQEVYQYGPAGIRDRDTALRQAEILEAHGWLVRLPAGTVVAGAVRQIAWRVIK